MTTKLPVILENIRIATPCNADWDDMNGDEKVRFCGKCEKNVYNLSSMTREEGEALVREKEGRLCVRLYARKDGTVLTADCPVGVRRERLRHRIWASVSGLAASAALMFGLAAGRARADLCVHDNKTGTGTKVTPQPHVAMGGAVAMPREVMGKIAMPPPPPPPEPKSPKKPRPTMGEPAPMMGDIAVEPVKTK